MVTACDAAIWLCSAAGLVVGYTQPIRVGVLVMLAYVAGIAVGYLKWAA